jgi:hypothetical protein
MSYKITLEVYVNEQATFPMIHVETQRHETHNAIPTRSLHSPADAEALEGVLTRTREFAETLTRGVEEVDAR